MKAIFYKEWIKVRWYYLLAIITTLGFSIFNILRINRVIEFKGAAHIWEVMIQKDVIFIDNLSYIPLIIGLGFAIVQFIPEMYHKAFKLTLHLPYSALKITSIMLFSGFVLLFLCFLLNYLVLNLYFTNVLPYELKWHILNTLTLWLLSGIATYFLIAWICIEPSWKMRVFNFLISLFVFKVFFISKTPEAYNAFLPYLGLYTILLSSLVWLSVLRFKAGKQG